jgi:PIN domain nuclease of toxin-antitoxin system
MPTRFYGGATRRGVCLPARVTKSAISQSVATLWEIAIKRALGKLKFDDDFEQVIHEEDFGLLAISLAHLQASEHLPVHHRNPFDRLLIAQALAEGIPIATSDRVFAAYGVQLIW